MKQTSLRQAALGFRAHSGWAALVVIAEPDDAPTIVDRWRIEIADAGVAGSRQPYHAAQQLNLREAEKLIAACAEASVRLSKRAITAAMDDATEKGFRISTSGVLTSSSKPLPALEKILSSHPLLHTAEGELFRNAIMTACNGCGLSVFTVKEKEILGRSLSVLRISEQGIQQQLARMGKTVGPPWRQDEKFATLVAWLALAAEAAGNGKREISAPMKGNHIQFSTKARKRGAKSC